MLRSIWFLFFNEWLWLIIILRNFIRGFLNLNRLLFIRGFLNINRLLNRSLFIRSFLNLNRLDFIYVIWFFFNDLILDYFGLEKVLVVVYFRFWHKRGFNLLIDLGFGVAFAGVLDNDDLRMHIQVFLFELRVDGRYNDFSFYFVLVASYGQGRVDQLRVLFSNFSCLNNISRINC